MEVELSLVGSARELIKQVAALPPQEPALFLHLLQTENGADPASRAANQVWPDFGERLHRIYGDKVAPDSQRIIDEGRGDR
jgi:hypothetical protein